MQQSGQQQRPAHDATHAKRPRATAARTHSRPPCTRAHAHTCLPTCARPPAHVCRQANWRLDPPLRRACRADVAELCRAEDSRGSEAGEVYRCLLANAEDLDPGCRKELGRAVHMAFFIWTPAALLTAPCDADVQALCLRARPNMDATPGAVGTCLAETVSGPPGWGRAGGAVPGHACCWRLRERAAAAAC